MNCERPMDEQRSVNWRSPRRGGLFIEKESRKKLSAEKSAWFETSDRIEAVILGISIKPFSESGDSFYDDD
ncbi:hypothetical protein [Rhodohalobacter sp.]|uniref:hypothetical protein n=1 Tax=Rhodohalobacter sp. TaxID=1974210 RepID=UPI002ACE5ABA|nr:hypothetical protein [Rhodohalobacter sp.]MDZ7757996.1 hypothetical protein [Rhodohalobacter sp.]